jgi:hypothetical protein
MKRLLAVALAVFAIGCATPAPLDVDDDVTDDTAKADGITHPLGTYRFQDETGDEGRLGFVVLVLMKDKTFHWAAPKVECVTNCPAPEVDGTYRFTSSGSYRYLRFFDQAGTPIAKYNYELKGTTLWVRRINTQDKYGLDHSDSAWCSWWSHCNEQGLAVPGSGGWQCQDTVCAFEPCAFGTYYDYDKFEGAIGVTVGPENKLDASSQPDAVLLGQILDLFAADYPDVTTYAQAIEVSQDHDFTWRLVTTGDGARYRVIYYYAGDNMVGGIFRESAVERVADIGDQSIYECKVP